MSFSLLILSIVILAILTVGSFFFGFTLGYSINDPKKEDLVALRRTHV